MSRSDEIVSAFAAAAAAEAKLAGSGHREAAMRWCAEVTMPADRLF